MLKVYTIWFRRGIGEADDETRLCVRWVKERGRERLEESAFRLRGTLSELVAAYLYRPDGQGFADPPIPIGIWLDRLQEEPAELVGASAEEVAAILAELRQRHPNGV